MSIAIILVIVLIVLAIIALVLVSSYNGFVRDRNRIQESWRQVDVELNRRYELLPNLVETVRAYAAHERNTLEDITRLRGQAQSLAQSQSGQPSEQRAQVEDQLSGAVRGLMVSVEAYPDLKSNQNFLELQRALAETEDRIANGRRFYNANVRQYNTRVESVPSNLIAGMFHFQKATYFEVTDPQARVAPSVNFGEIAYRGDPPGQQGQQGQPGQQGQQGQPGQQQLPQQGSFQQQPYQQQPYQPGSYQQPESYPQPGPYQQPQQQPDQQPPQDPGRQQGQQPGQQRPWPPQQPQ